MKTSPSTLINPVERPYTDRTPDIACEVAGQNVPGWVLNPLQVQPEHLYVMAPGWSTHAEGLAGIGNELALQDPGAIAVVLEQPRLPGPDRLGDVPGFIRSVLPANIAELRARSLLAIGAQACRRFGLDSIHYVSHSLAAIDTVQALEHSDGNIDAVTAMASAGFVPYAQMPQRLRSARSAKCDMRDTHTTLTWQLASEGLSAVFRHIEPRYTALSGQGTKLRELNFANDKMFPPVAHPQAFPDGYALFSNGHACHSSPGHPEDVAKIAAAILALRNA